MSGGYFGRGHYTYAEGKEEVTGAIRSKMQESLGYAEFYRKGLEKIAGLEEGGVYEVLNSDGCKLVVRVQKLRRDTVLFRIYAADGVDAEKYTLTKDDLSLTWGAVWTYKAVGLDDFPLYVGWKVRTKWFDKTFKKGA